MEIKLKGIIMAEVVVEKKQARGFAGILAKALEPLNSNPNFKETFGKTNRKFVLNTNNDNYAAVIIIKDGTLSVESVLNKPKENLSKKALGWDGFISMDSSIFLALALGRLSMIGVGLKFITGKVKMKGILKLLGLLKIMNFLK